MEGAAMAENGSLRTVSQLAKLTGIDYETVRYYCTPEKPSNPQEGKRGRKGAGLIEPTCRKGNWNLYDDDALMKLAIAGLMGKSGMSVKDMRNALQGEVDFRELIADQEKRLEKKLRSVKEELQTARMLGRFFKEILSDDGEDAFERMMNDYVALMLLEAGKRFDENDRYAPLNKLRPAKGTEGYIKKIDSIYRKRQSEELNGSITEELDEIANEMVAAPSPFQDAFATYGMFIEGVEGFYTQRVSPDAPEVIDCAAGFHKWANAMFRNVDAESLRLLIRLYFTENYIALMLELAIGPGFIDYMLNAVDAYCRNMNG